MRKKCGLVLILALTLLACCYLARFRCQLKYMTGSIWGTPTIAFEEFQGFADVPERFKHGQHVLIVDMPNDIHGAILKNSLTESSVWHCRESLPQMKVHFGQYTSWSDWKQLLDRVTPDATNFDVTVSQNAWPRGVIFWFEDGRVILGKEFCSLSSADALYVASLESFCRSTGAQNTVPCFGPVKCYLQQQ